MSQVTDQIDRLIWNQEREQERLRLRAEASKDPDPNPNPKPRLCLNCGQPALPCLPLCAVCQQDETA